jgi:hypothetical protein
MPPQDLQPPRFDTPRDLARDRDVVSPEPYGRRGQAPSLPDPLRGDGQTEEGLLPRRFRRRTRRGRRACSFAGTPRTRPAGLDPPRGAGGSGSRARLGRDREGKRNATRRRVRSGLT